jgi:chemosensory pili system protein ChpA (sensor histidine kinase/response regulator)
MPLSLSKSEPIAPIIEIRSVPNQRLALVVDDSASIRRQTQMLVERAGLKAMIASNGAEAIELLSSGEHHPDIIISDIEMPQVDGWGLLEFVKTNVDFSKIPMVMVTSLDADHHKDRAFDLGASEYVIKPFSGKVLERILEKLALTVAA